MSHLHQTIFSELCYISGAEDAALNKALRNLSQVKPNEIEDLNPAFFTSLPVSQSKMAGLNDEQSPRSKSRLLCDCLSCLPNATETGQAMSMDDLLPLLNYLIIKSEIPNWYVVSNIWRGGSTPCTFIPKFLVKWTSTGIGHRLKKVKS